ncbi:hypothetical protein EC988_007949, partial [Linderina pennispora]
MDSTTALMPSALPSARFFIPTSEYYHPAIRKDQVQSMSVQKLHAIRQHQRSTHRPADLRKTVLVYNVFKATMPEAALDGSDNASVQTVAAVSDNDMDMALQPVGTMNNPQPLVVPKMDCEEEISAAMDVDIQTDHDDMVRIDDTHEAAAEAERSWFDRCIDSMLTDEEPEPHGQFPHLLSPEDYDYDDDFEDEDEEFDAFAYGPGGQRTGISGYGTIYSQPGTPMLKHSRSSTSIQSLCMLERDGTVDAHGAHDAAERDTAANQPR